MTEHTLMKTSPVQQKTPRVHVCFWISLPTSLELKCTAKTEQLSVFYPMPSSSSLLATLACALVFCSHGTSAWPPQANGGWTDVTESIFPPNVGFPIRPSALVDWNGDQYIDMVVIGNGAAGSQSNVFAIYQWQDANHSFFLAYESPPLMRAESQSTMVADPISNVVAADFNRNGRNDVVVLTLSGALWVLHGSLGNLTEIGSAMLPPSEDGTILGSVPQLSVLNVFGRCALPDLVLTTTTGALYVLRNTLGDHAPSCNFIGGAALSFSPQKIDINVAPLSILTVDIGGMCNAQLMYGVATPGDSSTITYRLYDDVLGSSRDLFSVPDYAGVPVALDVNSDGATDFVFPFCSSTDTSCRDSTSDYSALLFVHNVVSGPVCGSDNCCVGFGASFSSVPAGADKGAGFDVLPISSFVDCPGLLSLSRSAPTNNGLITVPQLVRTGDYNRDSFPDVLVATNVGPVLLTRGNGAALPAAFQCSTMTPSSASGNSLIPFFFDIEEDGRLDLMIIDTEPTSSSTIGMYSFWNGLPMNEDYFLTAVILNGVNVADATANSPAPPGVGFPAYGATQVGSVHRFQWQDIETNLRTQVYTQQGASQAHALQNPRVHFGLGRTFSYIQNYASGIHCNDASSGSSSSLHYTWSSYLIPNSQVVVIPYPLLDTSSWLIKLFLSSSKYQTLLIIALCTALAVIGVPIVILKYREMKEDNAEMKRHA